MDVWVNILEKLRNHKTVALLYVIQSQGSSPGRQNFAMMVCSDGEIKGSIGGGIMEYKLVEKIRAQLRHGPFNPFIKEQVHQGDIPNNRSGMICSGSQVIAFYYLSQNDIELVQRIVRAVKENTPLQLKLNEKGIFIGKNEEQKTRYSSNIAWQHFVIVGKKPQLFIIGGGHVGLALSEIIKKLNFFITVLDDREHINTIDENSFADRIKTIDYREIGQEIPEGDAIYVVIMTFGYRTDEICIKQLLDKQFAYIGVMGSKHKMKTMWQSLRDQGIHESSLKNIYTPIGLPIHSKTPMEIAISVAAQIIDTRRTASI